MNNKIKIEGKIEEAREILKYFLFPIPPKNKIAPLTLLALCNIKPEDEWENAERKSMTLTKDIMEFVNLHYEHYKPTSKEMFRNQALNPFVEKAIAELNPDNPELPKNSKNTHYAINLFALNTIRKFETEQWRVALENFLKISDKTFSRDIVASRLQEIRIISYKSIKKDKIELGRFNIFIGPNGSGKSNILEAIGVAGAYSGNDLTYEGLYSRGVRIARPDLLISSFRNDNYSSIDLELKFTSHLFNETYQYSLVPTTLKDSYAKWINILKDGRLADRLTTIFSEIKIKNPELPGDQVLDFARMLMDDELQDNNENRFGKVLVDYCIYDLNTKSLRGITPADSKKTPLGLNGEGLDLLISSFNNKERKKLLSCSDLFDWLSEIVSDKEDKLKEQGLKPGRSTSNLYFKDKYMSTKNNTLSAENSNEGILHVLFYISLFISEKTPNFFAIDNIETALNPRMCQRLIKQLVELSKENNKQVLITTHNPSILDGLNLLDDEQRLFEVFRDDDGHTITRRIKFKKDLSDKPSKLSQMWLNGSLGALPKKF